MGSCYNYWFIKDSDNLQIISSITHVRAIKHNAWYHSLNVVLIYEMKCRLSVDPHPIHRPAWLTIFKKKKVKWKADFRVLKNFSQWGTVLFGVATYFLFLFLNGENWSKNKNPIMTPIRKKRYAKTRFWVRGSGYLSGRYLMRGSTPLGRNSVSTNALGIWEHMGQRSSENWAKQLIWIT